MPTHEVISNGGGDRELRKAIILKEVERLHERLLGIPSPIDLEAALEEAGEMVRKALPRMSRDRGPKV